MTKLVIFEFSDFNSSKIIFVTVFLYKLTLLVLILDVISVNVVLKISMDVLCSGQQTLFLTLSYQDYLCYHLCQVNLKIFDVHY